MFSFYLKKKKRKEEKKKKPLLNFSEGLHKRKRIYVQEKKNDLQKKKRRGGGYSFLNPVRPFVIHKNSVLREMNSYFTVGKSKNLFVYNFFCFIFPVSRLTLSKSSSLLSPSKGSITVTTIDNNNLFLKVFHTQFPL